MMHSHDLSKHELTAHEVEHLLEHWIEHNASHSASFRERAALISTVSPQAAEDIEQAAVLMDQSTEMLKKALQNL
jgi:phosphoserine phosphatase